MSQPPPDDRIRARSDDHVRALPAAPSLSSAAGPEQPEEVAPRAGRGKTVLILLWAVGGVGVLGLLVGLTLFGGPGAGTGPSGGRPGDRDGEGPLAAGRTALAGLSGPGLTGDSASLYRCRDAVREFNTHLAQSDAHRVPELPDAEAKKLQAMFGLSKAELEELRSPTFTLLDGYHLDACLLLREVARGLARADGDGPAGPGGGVKGRDRPAPPGRPAPLGLAEAAFAWTVREVRLRERDVPPAPTAFVLRRGSGSSLERALVFLALLEQFGKEGSADDLQGCLLFVDDRLWACGVLVGDRPELHLFDPRLGLPVPGPDGKGVATLGQVRAAPDDLLAAAFDAPEKKLRYDVTAASVREKVQARLVFPLSALAPRARLLQDRLLQDEKVVREGQTEALPAPIDVRLCADVSASLRRLRAALREAGFGADRAGAWREGAGLLWKFLPRKEGGGGDLGKDGRPLKNVPSGLDRYRLELVPWQEFPRDAIDPERFMIGNPLGDDMRVRFAARFWRIAMESGGPRDLILRGTFNKAAAELVSEEKEMETLKRMREGDPKLDAAAQEWLNQAEKAHAALTRARNDEEQAQALRALEQLRQQSAPINVLIIGTVAGPYGAEVAYQIALCKHEQAVRLQARAEAGSEGKAMLRLAWRDAEGWWRLYGERHRGRPGTAAARRLRGECLERLGRLEEAIEAWRDVSPPLTDWDRLAQLYLARRARAAKN
jgi:hypothetical protein